MYIYKKNAFSNYMYLHHLLYLHRLSSLSKHSLNNDISITSTVTINHSYTPTHQHQYHHRHQNRSHALQQLQQLFNTQYVRMLQYIDELLKNKYRRRLRSNRVRNAPTNRSQNEFHNNSTSDGGYDYNRLVETFLNICYLKGRLYYHLLC